MTDALSKISKKSIIAALISAALIFFAYHEIAFDLYAAWQTEEYSHGIIIPIIAALIAWHRLTETRPAIRPSWWGITVLAAGGLLQWLATMAAFETPADYGLLLSLAGLSLSFLGTKATKAMLPAFVYLLFAIPLPRLIFVTLSQDLQLMSSTLGVWFLDVVGVPVFQEGNIIDLGGYKLQVAEACSGLRYLFPLMSFGYLIAYLLKDRLWKRAIVFLSAIPITVGMNSFRIAFIGVTVDLWGSDMAEGFIHALEGWVVFFICVTLLMLEVWALLRVKPQGRFRFEYLGPARGRLFSGSLQFAAPVIAACLLAAAQAALFGTGIINERAEVRQAHTPFALFPIVLGPWHGQPLTLDAASLRELQPDDYLLANYTAGSAPLVNLYMVYYASQRMGASAHSPSNCIPGGGWQVASKAIKTITLAGGNAVTVSRLLIKRGDVTQLVYYWFDERGRDITENYSAKWYLFVDSVAMNRTDGAVIRLVTELADGEQEADAEKRLNDFLAVSYPVIKTFIPGKASAPVSPLTLSSGNRP